VHEALVVKREPDDDCDYGYAYYDGECWWGGGKAGGMRKKRGGKRSSIKLLSKDPKVSCAARLDAAVRHADKELDKALELMDAETYAALCAAIDKTRSQATCEPSLLDVEESDFTWWTQWHEH
jgi:hypothetical protein